MSNVRSISAALLLLREQASPLALQKSEPHCAPHLQWDVVQLCWAAWSVESLPEKTNLICVFLFLMKAPASHLEYLVFLTVLLQATLCLLCLSAPV